MKNRHIRNKKFEMGNELLSISADYIHYVQFSCMNPTCRLNVKEEVSIDQEFERKRTDVVDIEINFSYT